MLSALSVTTLLEVNTLLAALKPKVVVPKLIPVLAVSLVPTILMGPDNAKMLPLKFVATSTPVAVPDVPEMLMPPPAPVASMLPEKLMPKLLLVPLTPVASPTIEMACEVVFAERRVKPDPYVETACALIAAEPVALPVIETFPIPESMVTPPPITPKLRAVADPPEFWPRRVTSPPPEVSDVPDCKFTPEM